MSVRQQIPVSETNLVRAAGLAAAIGGMAWTLSVVLGEGIGGAGSVSVVLSAVSATFAAGLAGLFLRYDIGSRPCKAGFAQGFVGSALLFGGFITDAAGFGAGEQVVSFGLIIFAFGLVLVGFSYLKDEPMPVLNTLPLGVGIMVPVSLVLSPVEPLGLAASALFGLGWIVLGAVLVADARGAGREEKS